MTDQPSTGIRTLSSYPSYLYKLAEARRSKFSVGSNEDTSPTLRSRLDAYQLAESLHIDHPRVLGEYEDIVDVPLDTLGTRFVVKPTNGHSRRGLFALEREGDAYRDLIRLISWTPSSLIAYSISEQISHSIPATVFAEECLPERGSKLDLPHRWRLHCFAGQTALITKRDTRRSHISSDWRYRLWRRDWSPIESTDSHPRVDVALIPPQHPNEMLSTGDRISTALGRPFVAIDLFETERGIVLNGIVKLPEKPPVHSDQLDRELGELWESAAETAASAT